jgi:hypothetical protein
VEDKTLEDKDAEQPIVAPTVENKAAGIASHSKHPIGSARNVKPPKQWSFDEDNALISLVTEYQSKEMIVTQVFEEVKSLMPLTHILYSRSEEALGTHYRKLVNDQKCPPLRGSIARKGGGQADKKSVAARNGGGQAEKKRVEDVTARKNSGVAVGVPRKKRSGANTGSGANAGKNSGVGPRIGEELAAALEVIFDYFGAKVAHKIGDMFPKTKMQSKCILISYFLIYIVTTNIAGKK